jgi:aminoglycoside phosphotransferase (APT) family kinase protein
MRPMVDEIRLAEWLASETLITGPVTAQPVGGGNSNATFLLRAAAGSFILRRPPGAALSGTAHSMAREYRVLRALAGSEVAAPRPIAFCDDADVIGAPSSADNVDTGAHARGLPSRQLPLLGLRTAVSRSAGSPEREDLAARYAERSGRSVEDLAWYMALALWRLAAIVEGAYAQYLDGRLRTEYARRLAEDVPRLLEEAAFAARLS